MNILDFGNDLILEVQSGAMQSGRFDHDVFTEVAVSRLQDFSELPDIELCQFMGIGKHRKKIQIDGYTYDPLDRTFYGIVSDFSPDSSATKIGKTEVDELFGNLKAFFDHALDDDAVGLMEASSGAAQAALDLRQRLSITDRFRLVLVTNRALGERVKSLASITIGDRRADLVLWDLQRLFDSYNSTKARESIEIDFGHWMSGGMPAIEVRETDELSVYLLAIPGKILAEIYEVFGSRLLESNVRSFLSLRGAVNKGIRSTIIADPTRFLAFNNGIVATCSSLELSSSGKASSSIQRVHNLQIVNGGQTTASMYYFLKGDSDKADNLNQVWVQMKLIVVEDEAQAELVPSIARFANTQNRVSEADFFSNSPFHVRMEEISRRLVFGPAPGSVVASRWFYERARGAYLNEKMRSGSPANQRKFEVANPRHQVITKTDMAKYFNSWDRRPHVVSKGSQKNFIEFANTVADRFASEGAKNEFGDDFYRSIVGKALIFSETQKAIKKSKWYESGYLANITTYAIALLSDRLKQARLEPNWAYIAKNLALPKSYVDGLAEAALASWGALSATDRPTTNISEYAKTEGCWARVKATAFEISESVKSDSISLDSDEFKEQKKEAKASGQLLGEIEKLKLVTSISTDTWAVILQHPKIVVSPKQKSIVKLVTDRKVPSEAQMAVLDPLIQRAHEEGIL